MQTLHTSIYFSITGKKRKNKRDISTIDRLENSVPNSKDVDLELFIFCHHFFFFAGIILSSKAWGPTMHEQVMGTSEPEQESCK